MGIESNQYGVTIMERFKNGWLPYTLLFMMGTIFCLIIFWTIYPTNIFDVISTEFINVKQFENDLPVYHPGDVVTLEFTYTKYYKRSADIARFLVKQNEPDEGLTVAIIATTLHGNLPTGTGRGRINFIIPITTPPGIYKARTNISYYLNPIRPDFVEVWYTDEFMVRNKVNE